MLSFPPAPAPQALAGTNFGVDFNPRADLLRIVSDTGQNLRVNLQAGRVIAGADGVSVARAAGFAFVDGTKRLGDLLPEAISTAYRGAALPGVVPLDFQYIIAARDNSLGRVVVPNDGAIDTVGPLGVTLDADAASSFDISGASCDTLKLAALVPSGGTQSVLYTINLQTGAATMVGPIGGVNDPLVTAISGPILR